MEVLDELLIRHACERLCLDYARLIDLGRASEAIELFTDDAQLTLTAGPMAGRAEIGSFFTKRQAAPVVSRHVVTNVAIDVTSATSAIGTAYVTLYRTEHHGPEPAPLRPPVFVGHYEDRFALTPAGWRFQQRTSVAALQS